MSTGGLPYRGCSILKRREARWTLLCVTAGLLSACASGGGPGKPGISSQSAARASRTPPAANSGPAEASKVGAPYQINGVWYYPQFDSHYDAVGTASWYGEAFHGQYTANGEVYDMNALTAAHTTLQLPCNVEVTNLENGRALVLRVNDRGPFINGRVIDVSRRAAQLLGFEQKGTTMVRVRVVPDVGDTMLASAGPAVHAKAVVAPMPSGNTVPLASSGGRADRTAVAYASSASDDAAPSAGAAPLTRVSMAPVADPLPSPAKASMAPIADPAPQPRPEIEVASLDPVLAQPGASQAEPEERTLGSLLPPRAQPARAVEAEEPWMERPTVRSRPTPTRAAQAVQSWRAPAMPARSRAAGPRLVWTVGMQPAELRHADVQTAVFQPAAPRAVAPRTRPEGGQGLYIQAGAFTDTGNAEHLRAQLAGFGPTDVMTTSVGGRVFHRVRIGPLSNADLALAKLRQMGHPEAHIVPQ